MNLRQLDPKHFGRQGEPDNVVVGNSADSYLTDTRGRKYVDFMIYSTYGWHPHAVAVALANRRYLACHRNKLLKNTTQLGQYFLTRLSQMSFKEKATVRGRGFASGIEVKDEDYASEVGDNCRENGLLVSAEKDVLMLFPALTITRETAERGLGIFERFL